MYQLRCERCGYSLEGSPGPAVCPECGLAGAASEPKNRTGTPFQRHCRAGEVLPTVRMVLLKPGVALKVVRPVWWESWKLHLWLLFLTSLVVGVGLVGLLVTLNRPFRMDVSAALIFGVFAGIPVFIALFMLCRVVEIVLERWCGPPRGRLDRAGSVTVVAHSLPALLVTGVVLGAVGLANTSAGVVVPYPSSVAAALAAGGLLWFTLLLLRGVRELRHANRLREWVEPDGGDA